MQGCSRISTSKLPMRDRKGGSVIVDYPVIFCNTIQVISLILNARKAQVITEKSYTAVTPDCCAVIQIQNTNRRWNETRPNRRKHTSRLHCRNCVTLDFSVCFILCLDSSGNLWSGLWAKDLILRFSFSAAFCSFLSMLICIFRSLDRSSGTLNWVPSLQVTVLMKGFL